jgi:hypothetical protein
VAGQRSVASWTQARRPPINEQDCLHEVRVNAGPHLAIGAACELALSGASLAEHAPAIGLCAAAALLPDLDHHSSVASSWRRTGLTLVAVGAGVVAGAHTAWIVRQPIGASVIAVLTSLCPQ